MSDNYGESSLVQLSAGILRLADDHQGLFDLPTRLKIELDLALSHLVYLLFERLEVPSVFSA